MTIRSQNIVRSKLFARVTVCTAFVMGSFSACVQTSSSDESSVQIPLITGTAVSQTGEEGTLTGWYAVLLDATTSVARVGTIEKTGAFVFKQLSTRGPFSLFVLSPDMKLSSMIVGPGTVPKKLRTLFTIKGTSLPKMVVKGLNTVFTSTDGIDYQSPEVDDQDDDGIPDGMKSATIGGALNIAPSSAASLASEDADTDKDGIPNREDSDIDGDGLPNVLDPDDDGDGILDVVDEDANGDGIADVRQTAGDAYFSTGVTYFSTLFTLTGSTSGAATATLNFKTQLRPGVKPVSMTIRAPEVLTKQMVLGGQKWDGTLADDGMSGDEKSGDGVWGRIVGLNDSSVIRPSQLLFLQLGFDGDGGRWYMEFPFAFPPLSVQTVSAKYDRSSHTVSLDGTPFGGQKGFTWSVTVYNGGAAGSAVYSSDPIKGTQTDFVIPDRILEANHSYQADVTAQLLDRIPGNPCCASRSAKVDLQ